MRVESKVNEVEGVGGALIESSVGMQAWAGLKNDDRGCSWRGRGDELVP